MDIKSIEAAFIKKDMPAINVGDTVKVMTRIAEGSDKFRLHPFEGVIISKCGSGPTTNFTVRKVSFGEGIERVFPLYSPVIERIELIRSGKVKRAKLYYLRGKVGKHATKIESKEEVKN
ncbi:MAG: 50S ribosomal protein L19 [Candidatus Omnitrophota bacterium]